MIVANVSARGSVVLGRILLAFAVASTSALCLAGTVFVAPDGDNHGDGSLARPYRTISHALAQLRTGDTCLVRGGTYREALDLTTPGTTLAAYNGEEVIVTGCDLVDLTGCATYVIPQSGVSCIRVDMASKVLQLFAEGRRMELARWPDKAGSMLSMKDWEDSFVDGKSVDKTATFAALPAKGRDYWKGGYYVGMNDERYPKRPLSTWFSTTGRIESSDGSTLHLTALGYGVGTPYANGAGYGYIVNCLGALDAPGEWYWGDGYLYLKPSGSGQLADGAVEARTRMYVLNVLADGVRVRGIHFKAGTAMIKGARASIEKCIFRYVSPFVWNEASEDPTESGARCNWGDYRNGSNGICVLGDGATMTDCYVAHSWFSGMVIWGNSCRVENCVIEDVNWISKRCAGINSFGTDVVVRYCTIRNMGASCIEGGNGNWLKKYAIRNLWEHNRLENVGLLGADSNGAFIYVNHQDGSYPPSDTEWRYNFCVHSRGPDKGDWGDMPALYVDNNSSGYRVHHNVVIDAKVGIRYNDFADGDRAGRDVAFYNNTFYKVDRAMTFGLRPNLAPDADVVVENTLAVEGGGYGHPGGRKEYGPSNIGGADIASFKDPAHGNLSLADARYVDAGVIIPGVTMDFVGKAPDIGAFESGQPVWMAGATLTIEAAFLHDEPPAPGAAGRD